jgi:hypothetical protein
LQAGEAQTSDTGKLKHNGLSYILRNSQLDVVTPLITRAQSKANCGFNHLVIACMLCPRHLLDEFDDNVEYVFLT